MVDTLIGWAGQLGGESWAGTVAYLTNGKHLAWYASFRFTLIAALCGALLAVIFGLLGAGALRSRYAPVRVAGHGYVTMVRGIPDVLFFLFFPLVFEQAVEFGSAYLYCSSEELADDGRWPPCRAAQWFLTTTDYLVLACFSLGIVYGAFAANVINGAMNAVPRGQLEAARAYGFSQGQVFWQFQVRQMWVYALPGLSNVWMLLLKATSLLSLLQIADIVLWANRLGAPNYNARAGFMHPDWRWRYYLALFLLYIVLTLLSELLFAWLQRRASRGMVLNNR